MEYNFNSRTYIMGILNITPDSFSDGGKFYNGTPLLDNIIQEAVNMEKWGADFIDIGGESTRPDAEEIDISEEIKRVIPVIRELKKYISIPLSIDTYKSTVAEEAVMAGADMINDISGFSFDEKIINIAAKYNTPYILMHMKGTPQTMQRNPEYINVIDEINNYFYEKIEILKSKGVSKIIIDPGIGFGKNFSHNIDIIRNLNSFKIHNLPLMLGLSRKRFINNIYSSEAGERLEGTLVANSIGISNGANILRVHDVLSNKRAALTADILLQKENS